MIVTVGCNKGGVGKTTTAVMLAVLLADQGPTVLIDGDGGGGSASTWWQLADQRGEAWPLGLSLETWREPMTLPAGLTHVVIDTPPSRLDRFEAALRLSDHAVIPVGAEEGEAINLGTTTDVIEKVAQDRELIWGVLLTKVVANTIEARTYPAALEEQGFPRFEAHVPRSIPKYSRIHGHVPDRPWAYRDVLAELQEG